MDLGESVLEDYNWQPVATPPLGVIPHKTALLKIT